MGFTLAHFECNLHDRIKTRYVVRRIVSCGVENEAIVSFCNGRRFREHLGASAIGIGGSGSQRCPAAILLPLFEAHRNAGSRLAKRGVQDMR